jgi:hypothetical protein
MTKPRPILVTLISAATLSPGCSLFKKSSAPKESTALAAETDQILMQRWVDKRSAELVAQGQSADAARNQAMTEFRERYGYTNTARK